MIGARAAALAATMMLVGAGTAHADILFVDTNDQAIERRTIDELARQYGETVHIVKGDGPEIEEIFRRAQAGEIELTTIVGSGHSSGTTFTGANGSLSGIDEMLEKYPSVRDQVRHFIGLGCYTGTRYSAAEWQGRFPNATFLAGFNGLAPSGHWSARFLRQVFTSIMTARRNAGGTDEALANRLGSDPQAIRSLHRILAALDSVKITVASFQTCEEFFDPKGRTREKIKEEVQAGLSVFRQYLNAWSREDVPENPHAPSPLRTFYNDVQEYLGVATPEEREELAKAKDQAIRLIYFGNVKANFADSLDPEEVAAVNTTLEAAGMDKLPEPSAIPGMTRQALVRAVQGLSWRLDGLEGEGAEAAKALYQRYQNELIDLQVPFSWIDRGGHG